MPEFKKNNRFSGGPRKSFNKGPSRPSFGGGRDFGAPKEMYEAECNSCHKSCQVPFRPNGKKPVYCRDCFTPDDRAPQGRPERRSFDSRDSRPATPSAAPDRRIDDIKRQLDAMNATLERIAASLQKSERSAALTEEMQKYTTPKEAPAAKKAPAKKVAKKKIAKKA